MVVQVNVIIFRMLYSRWVSARYEMGYTGVHTGRCVPEHLVWTTIVHWGRPNSKDCMLRIQSTII